MSAYPLLEQDGFCVLVTAEKAHGRRWRCWVQFERDHDFARLKMHPSPVQRVPNDYPNEALAVQAAYDHARVLISRELEKH